MAYAGQSVLAVVPARGGSKSIPRKNLQVVGGVSLVGRAAALAASIDWIDEAVISTDDDEILAEAVTHGLDAPFMRPPELSGDTATSVDMWHHAWLASEAHYKTTFAISVLLEPTSPLRTADDIERTVAALTQGGHAAAATVSPTPAHFTPHKTLTVDANERIGFYVQGGHRFALRQSIPRYFHRNGLCYAARRKTLVEGGTILENDCVAVVVDRPVVNIDDVFELELAEYLLRREGRA
ncbi:MAG: acylneuraminate cytidylyltransferase family protein [Alphaproteobacteria bacterium]|nr:acylneuraminate cytidylyltransferase family protein [Alphaproteobacteria bacterium]